MVILLADYKSVNYLSLLPQKTSYKLAPNSTTSYALLNLRCISSFKCSQLITGPDILPCAAYQVYTGEDKQGVNAFL